jgi:hypothetical protein
VSAERALPWWASEGPVAGGVDRGGDPIEQHRAARRGGLDADGPSPDPPPASPRPTADGPLPPEPARHRVDACGVCPFCASMRLLQETRPELVEHLTEAARHLAAAARSLLDTPVPSPTERSAPPPPRPRADAPSHPPVTADGRLQRIVLDDPPPDPAAPAGGS